MSEKLYTVTFNGNALPVDVSARLLAIFAGKTVAFDRTNQAPKLGPVTFKARYESVEALANNAGLANALQTATGTFKIHVPEVVNITIDAKNLIEAGKMYVKDLEALLYRRSVKADLEKLVKVESLVPETEKGKGRASNVSAVMDTFASFLTGNDEAEAVA